MNNFVYGTGNPAKLKSMRKTLANLDAQIIGLAETGLDFPEPEENGSSPLENAQIKALAYYGILKRPVFACDSGLYINGLSDEEQPGVHVRTVNNKRLSDDEMIEHYTALAKRFGGKATARYRNAICLILNDNEIYEYFGDDISSIAFYLTDTPHLKRVNGFPLDSLSVNIKTGKYYYDETDSRSEADGGMDKGFQAFFKQVINKGDIV